MTPEQIKLARHALGLPHRSKRSYRNHFVTGESCADHANWNAMVDDGMAKVRRNHPLTDGDDLFFLTLEGAKAALKKGEKLCPKDFPQAVEK